jgi:PhzF family phenazine biosynthesis protein
MDIPIYHIDAFTEKKFSGNPAAVCVLSKWLEDDILHAIAKENNLPVTTFLVRDKNLFHVRWITPEYELDICGHGTLSAGFVIFNYLEPSWQKVILKSKTETLEVLREDNFIILNFPAKKIENVSLTLVSSD